MVFDRGIFINFVIIEFGLLFRRKERVKIKENVILILDEISEFY